MKDLQTEIKALKDIDKKREKEIQALKDVATKREKEYLQLTGDIKKLCDALTKNDERITSLEALVQEESDTEEGKED